MSFMHHEHSSYIVVKRHGYSAFVRESVAEIVANALLDHTGCVPAGLTGRGTLTRFPLNDGTGLVRTSRRGGIIRLLLKDAYLLVNRPRRELEVHEFCFEQGLSVPEPLGVVWKQQGVLVRGAIATREIPGVTLLEHLIQNPETAKEVLAQCGAVIRKMHDIGVYHADLQVKNLVVTQDGVYLVDFDNARTLSQVSSVQRARNLFRLRRSIQKNGLPYTFFDYLLTGYGPCSLPGWLSVAYRIKGAVSDVVNGRTNRDMGKKQRIDGLTVYLNGTLDSVKAVQIAAMSGETLKSSRKSTTRRVGDYVVKSSRAEYGLGILKRTVQRSRYRRHWTAANYLMRWGVPVAPPRAMLEKTAAGMVVWNAVITDYLAGSCTVEHYAQKLVEKKADQTEISAFLTGLAAVVNKLTDAGAYHADLSGKNILTRDSSQFWFIDLDGVQVGRRYTDALRLKNHVQLYDSFCDYWGEDLLGPFILQMTPPQTELAQWIAAVKSGQAARRARIEARWRKQGGRKE